MASASQRARKNRQRKYVNRETTNQPKINQTNNTGDTKMNKDITDLNEYKKTRKFSIKRLAKSVLAKVVAVKNTIKTKINAVRQWFKKDSGLDNGTVVFMWGGYAALFACGVTLAVIASKAMNQWDRWFRIAYAMLQDQEKVIAFFETNQSAKDAFGEFLAGTTS